MWNDNDKMLKMFDQLENKGKYPCKCPNCNQLSGHMFLYQFDEEDNIGSGWAWCSSCKGYTHVTYRIPNWWVNPEGIEEEELESEPIYLDEISKKLDDHLNMLMDKKYDN